MATNNNPNPTSTQSQTKKILAYMKQGYSITPREARKLCRSDRLGARIMDIEKIVGYKPPRKRVEVVDYDNDGRPIIKRVMSYWLRDEDVERN